MSKMRLVVAAAGLAVALVASEAAAQQSGLINVDIRNVANNIARDLDVNVSNIPVTVQVPVGVAANVCEVNANVLAEQRRQGGANCEAQNTSTALNRIVQRNLVQQ